MGAESPPTTWQVAELFLLNPSEQGKLLAYARERFGIAAEDARDLIQDTALELLRQQTFVESPQGFIFAIFRSRCCRFLDAARRRREVFEPPPSRDGLEVEPCAPDEGTERQVALREALAVVSSSCRQLLAAYYVEGKTLVEAARRLEMAATGASKSFNRCLQRLRRCLS
jgi:RNA polymerase sigma factor (sigma-70 family)